MSLNLRNRISKSDLFKSDLAKALNDLSKLKELARWDNDNYESQIDTETLRRYLKVKSKEAEEFNNKKEHLKNILISDEKEILKERKTLDEEKRERLKFMREQAELLEKQKREADEKIAREKYDQRLREECSEFRQELSKRRANEIAHDLLIQIEMKQKQNLLEKRLNDYLDTLVLHHSEDKSDEAAAQIVVEGKKCVANFLRQQIERKEHEKLAEKREKMKQANALEERNKQLQQEKEDEIEQKKLKSLMIKSDLDKCLQEKLLRKSEENNQKSQYNSLLTVLNQQIDAEKSEQQRDKVALENEARQYLEHIRNSKEVEKEYDKELNRIIDGHIAEQQKIDHHKQMQLLTARENLKNDVNEVCRQQIIEKKRKHDVDKLERIEEAKHLNEFIQKLDFDSKHKLHLQRQKIAAYRKALEQQIADQRNRHQQLLADKERDLEENKKTQEHLDELVHKIVNSNENDLNKHPWQKLVATGHSSIPVWDGELKLSEFANTRH
ncbi:unnamed protein product [Schistosoma turkestanicum]|nr:unnamed protein product [Schistosoma turkestanicum]